MPFFPIKTQRVATKKKEIRLLTVNQAFFFYSYFPSILLLCLLSEMMGCFTLSIPDRLTKALEAAKSVPRTVYPESLVRYGKYLP